MWLGERSVSRERVGRLKIISPIRLWLDNGDTLISEIGIGRAFGRGKQRPSHPSSDLSAYSAVPDLSHRDGFHAGPGWGQIFSNKGCREMPL
jgi:hypothetical protein